MISNNHFINTKNNGVIETLDISHDGKLIFVGQQGDSYGNMSLSVWSMDDFELKLIIENDIDIEINIIRILSDNNTIAYIKDYREICFYNLELSKRLDFRISDENTLWLSASKESQRMVVSGTTLDVWDVQKMEKVWTHPDYTVSNEYSNNPPGKQWHHIHEQSANGPNSVENIALTTDTFNQTLNHFYGKPQPDITGYRGMPLRKWLGSKPPSIHRKIGLDAIESYGRRVMMKNKGRGSFQQIV